VSDLRTLTRHGVDEVAVTQDAERDTPVDATTYLDAHPQAWSLILEALPDGTALLDPHGVMCQVNAALSRLSGYSRDELVGQSVMMLVPTRLRGLEGSARRHSARNRETPLIWSNQELSIRCKDGHERSVDFALSNLEMTASRGRSRR
jgi:two-component system, sensor histidine kinase PdtaS